MTISSNTVNLSYTEEGEGSVTVVLLHGFGCDRTYLAPQASLLASRGYRVVSPDLRGHGASPAPEGDYSFSVLASDVRQLCRRLDITQVIVVGHSMGGLVGLYLAEDTSLVAGLLMIDATVCAPAALMESLQPIRSLMREPCFQENYTQIMQSLAGPHGHAQVCSRFHDSRPRAPQHVLISALDAHFDQPSITAAADRCRVPTAYIAAASPLSDLTALKQHIPQLLKAQTLGSGHFAPLCVPEQINPMILDFARLAQHRLTATHEASTTNNPPA